MWEPAWNPEVIQWRGSRRIPDAFTRFIARIGHLIRLRNIKSCLVKVRRTGRASLQQRKASVGLNTIWWNKREAAIQNSKQLKIAWKHSGRRILRRDHFRSKAQ